MDEEQDKQVAKSGEKDFRKRINQLLDMANGLTLESPHELQKLYEILTDIYIELVAKIKNKEELNEHIEQIKNLNIISQRFIKDMKDNKEEIEYGEFKAELINWNIMLHKSLDKRGLLIPDKEEIKKKVIIYGRY